MASRRHSIGRKLTAGPVCLTMEDASRRSARRVLFWVLALVIVVAVALYFVVPRIADALESQPSPTPESESELLSLQAELEDTRRSLERALLDLDIAGVTQAELERQLGVLTEQHKEVRSELEFYKSAGSRSRGN